LALLYLPNIRRASLYPFAIVLSPTVLLYENVSPAPTTVPFILAAANFKFVLLATLLAY
jgi:hypothetical protein